MVIFGLHVLIWVVLILYFAGVLLLGWWSKREIHGQEGYLLGNRQFGTLMMVMHAFGAGTHPGNAAGVVTATVARGVSGIWVSWMWLFGTPFYWLIAPVVRRMRYLTMADFYEKRFGKAASILYIIVASAGMIVFLGGVLLATTRTVQGMMGKAATVTSTAVSPIDAEALSEVPAADGLSAETGDGYVSQKESDLWFFGILLVSTAVFIVYSYWGGIIAAIRTDMIQGLMIIALSFIAIPAALRLQEVGGMRGLLDTLAAQESANASILRLFDPQSFNIWTVLLLCINAPLTALAFPHLISVCGAGKTEWQGRVGFTYGNVLKRVCTIGWSVLGLAWLVYLINSGVPVNAETAFGDSIRRLLPPVLQGVMLACVMAAAMSSGDAVQVTVAGLFSQNLYRVYVNPQASEQQLVRFTRFVGVGIALVGLILAILMRSSIVKALLDYFNILSLIGVCTAMGILWRRMNTTGVFAGAILAVGSFVVTRYICDCSRAVTIGVPILMGVLGGVTGSLLTAPSPPERVEEFFKRIYTPIGAEDRLKLSLDEVVPAENRLTTAGGLFIVRPSLQSVVGFVITLAICLACVAVMMALLKL